MEFIILIFINIIMGTVFYLILRLRLEKHASDYREKRLKREIDEIISVFNETAERNITILENRIEYLKKILEKSKAIEGVDLKIDDLKFDDSDSKPVAKTKTEIKKSSGNVVYEKKSDGNISDKVSVAGSDIEVINHEIVNEHERTNGQISRYYSQIKFTLTKVYNSLKGQKTKQFNVYNIQGKSIECQDAPEIFNKIPPESILNRENTKEENTSEVKDILNPIENDLEDSSSLEISYSKLKEMFNSTEDKYLLISELFNEGYPPELICKCSGIPIGEIKLVLDLNNRI